MNLSIFFLFLIPVISSVSYAFAPGRVAMIQYNANLNFGKSAYNTKNLTDYAIKATQNGANIIIFPEGSTHGYAYQSDKTGKFEFWCDLRGKNLSEAGGDCFDVSSVAEPVPSGPTTDYWAGFAVQNKVYILFSIIEIQRSDYYNTVVVVGPQGYIGRYHKRELIFIDEAYAKSGSDDFILKTPYGDFGLLICADVESEKIWEGYSSKKINAVLLPMDWAERGAVDAFGYLASKYKLDIFAADESKSDGTGFYSSRDGKRYRKGLTDTAFGVEGLTYFDFSY